MKSCSSRSSGRADIFLPGLTADHRLFEKQVEHFDGKANVLVWDAPSHGESRPFALDWMLDDLARFLKKYNREWEKRAGREIHWIEGAGHNSNCDAPDIANALIEQFIGSVSSSEASCSPLLPG